MRCLPLSWREIRRCANLALFWAEATGTMRTRLGARLPLLLLAACFALCHSSTHGLPRAGAGAAGAAGHGDVTGRLETAVANTAPRLEPLSRRLPVATCAGDTTISDNGTIVVGGFDSAGDALVGGGSYANSLDCSWRLVARAGHRVRLRFVALDVEYHSKCYNDVVDVLEPEAVSGGGSVLVTLAKLCGDALPAPFVSLGGELRLRFSSNRIGVARGFVAQFDSAPACDSIDLRSVGDSLAYNGLASTGAVCAWRIAVPPSQVPAGSGVALRFDDASVACPASVDVRAGNDTAAPLLWSFCRDKAVPFTTPAVAAGTLLHVSLRSVEAARSTVSATVVVAPLARSQPSSRSPLWSRDLQCDAVQPNDQAMAGSFAPAQHKVIGDVVGVLAVALADVRLIPCNSCTGRRCRRRAAAATPARVCVDACVGVCAIVVRNVHWCDVLALYCAGASAGGRRRRSRPAHL